MGGDSFAVAIISALFVSMFVTLWLLAVHLLWNSDSLILKILAIIIGGLPMVLLAIFIQFIYENLILERKVS
ncbi:hypothetical protein RE474_06100 [Methanolobus sediminis]|uniref:Uncharacterized protein n=1 Tax=Methanolobus sediminis TaxID=3072978 RepID=A0AA51UPV4_9EURY|nr:hypothetical protein [Methanolobus sediminis]WMW26281.1 hypothetical protein RE474_06100 [Methanolobus sediminis]